MAFGMGGFTEGLSGALGIEGSSEDLTDVGIGSVGDFMKAAFKNKKKTTLPPVLKPVAPPGGATIRSSDPFDFFGTLFTNPATSGLNPITNFNKTPLY